MHLMRPRFSSFERARVEPNKSNFEASNALSLSTEVQAHLASLLGFESDMSVLLTAYSSETSTPATTHSSAPRVTTHQANLSATSSGLIEEGQDNEYADACSEKSLSIRSDYTSLCQFGLTPEIFDRVGGWENLSLSVEEARARINLNSNLVRALTSPLAADSQQSCYEMMTSLISSLSALVLQSSRFEGEHFFHMHFSYLWGLDAALVSDLAHCVVDSLMERGIRWPGDDIAQANPKYNQMMAVHKIKTAFASLVGYKPALSRVDEDQECDHSLQLVGGGDFIGPLSRSFAASQFMDLSKSTPLPKMGRSSIDSNRDIIMTLKGPVSTSIEW